MPMHSIVILVHGVLVYMDFENDGEINHATMISSIINGNEIRYTAHSDPRFNESIFNVFKRKKKCIMKIIVFY